MDVGFIVKSLPLYGEALKVTLFLGLWGIGLSLVIGFIGSLIRYFKVPVLKMIVEGYVELSRNTPLLIQLFFLYYGLPKMGITLSAESCGILGLAFLGGSYMMESFRGGIEAVGKGQIESGLSIGLKKTQLVRYIILPQAFSVALPTLGANSIFLLKETSIVGGIAIADVMFVAKDLIGMYYATTEALLMLVISYLILLLPLSLGLSYLERRLRYGTYGPNSTI